MKPTTREPLIFACMLLAADLAIILDVPFMRQILGFLFLTILPGLLLLRIIRPEGLESGEKFVLGMGLGISFVMIFGAFMNCILYYFGYPTPLSVIPVLISFNLSFLLMYLAGRSGARPSFDGLHLSAPEKAFLIPPLLFLGLSITGTYLMNVYGNNLLLMLLLILIPLYVLFVCLYRNIFPKRIYPPVILLISLSILLLPALRSNHLLGSDIHTEYYVFKSTLDKLHWEMFMHTTLDACLSISLLPTVYYSILNVSPEYLFKVLYPLLYSISPLVIYIISRKYVDEIYAFVAASFFMFQHNFIFTSYNPRTNLAILFFGLAMMALFNDRMKMVKRRLLFIAFIASCIVSHYSTSYIVFLIMLPASVLGWAIFSKYDYGRLISLTLPLLIFAMLFFWYSQITESAFVQGVLFIKTTIVNLNNFFLEESRGRDVQALLGQSILAKPLPYQMEFVSTWANFALIGVGFIMLLLEYKNFSFPESRTEKYWFLKEKFSNAYSMIAVICVVLLLTIVILPFVSKGYGIDRLFAVGTTILSVFFVIGGAVIAKRLNVQPYLVILIILIPYFLCVSGFMYNVFGYPRSIILNSQGQEQYDIFYVHDQETYCAMWLKSNVPEKSKIYSDWYGPDRLTSQGMIRNPLYGDPFVEGMNTLKDGYVYFRYTAVVDDKLMDKNYEWHNLSDYSYLLSDTSVLYDNGGSQVDRMLFPS